MTRERITLNRLELEERLAQAEADRDRLVQLALIHCPTEHDDFEEIVDISDRIGSTRVR